jgi:hypothetical protein
MPSEPDSYEMVRYCESGCGCRYGTNDPDMRECACDGPCCMASDEEWYGEWEPESEQVF